jgi:hypothetical protein
VCRYNFQHDGPLCARGPRQVIATFPASRHLTRGVCQLRPLPFSRQNSRHVQLWENCKLVKILKLCKKHINDIIYKSTKKPEY